MAGMGTGRHLEAGTDRPDPPAKDVLRVYGMKFCPFVHRLKLVLVAKQIKHETININLKKKPEWYFDINPNGTVPAIEINGNILFESDIVSNYVDEVFGSKKLTSSDPLKKAQELIAFGDFKNMISSYTRYHFCKDDSQKAQLFSKVQENFGKVVQYFDEDKNAFICGQEPGIIDYMVWPFFERMLVSAPELLKDQSVLRTYIDRMLQDRAVQECRHTDEMLLQFLRSSTEGSPVYDIGTVTDYTTLS